MKRFSVIFFLLIASILFCPFGYCEGADVKQLLSEIDIESAEKAIKDIAASFGDGYKGDYPARFIEYKKLFAKIRAIIGHYPQYNYFSQ